MSESFACKGKVEYSGNMGGIFRVYCIVGINAVNMKLDPVKG